MKNEIKRKKDQNDSTENVETKQIVESTGEVIEAAISQLTPLQATVLRLHYGFYDGKVMSIEEVAKELNKSCSTIERIITTALRKLRNIKV